MRSSQIAGALLCVACASPFPLEDLEEGMTSETVRDSFGEPEARETGPQGKTSCWTYLEDPSRLSAARSVVLLDFDEDRLARWDVYEPLVVPGTARWKPVGVPAPGCPSSSIAQTPCTPVYTVDPPTFLPFPEPPTCGAVRAQVGRPGGLRVGDTGTLRADRVSLWSEPTVSRARRAYLESGRRLKLLEKKAGPGLTWWCQVEDDCGGEACGGEGWILCEFLAASEIP